MRLDLPQPKLECLNCKSLISEQIALTAVFSFGQVFVFCRLTNENVLEWFLRIIWRTLNKSVNFFSRNHPTLCFWSRREGRQIFNTEQLIYQTKKSSHWRFSIKMLFLKILEYSWKNSCVKFLTIPILKNNCVRLPLNWLY